MAERIFTDDERERVEALARKRGFSSIRDYMHSLVDSDATSHGEMPLSVEDINDDDDAIRAAIRQGMRDVLNGNVLTEEEFWKAVSEDE